MADGIGCKCMARYEGECSCDDVDWTPQETIALRAELAAIEKEQALMRTQAMQAERYQASQTSILVAKLEAENQKLRDALTAIINTAPGSAHRIARMALG